MVFKKRTLMYFGALLVLVGGCSQGPGTASSSALTSAAFKNDFKSELTNALKSTMTHMASAQTHPAVKNFGFAQYISGISGPSAASNSSNDSMIGDMIAAIVDGPVGSELLNPNNIIQQSNNQITYQVKPSLCEIAGGTLPASAAELCKTALTQNQIELQVTRTDAKSYSVALLLGPAGQAGPLASFFTLSFAPSALGFAMDFSGLLNVANIVAKSNEQLAQMLQNAQASGALSAQVQYASDGLESGCRDGGDLCLTFDVTTPISISVPVIASSLSWAISPSNSGPVLFVSGTDKSNDFHATLNLGEIKANFASKYKLDLPGLLATILAPGTLLQDEAEIQISNIDLLGPITAASGMQSTELQTKSGPIKTLNILKSLLGVRLSLSPSEFSVKLTNDNNSQCAMSETLDLQLVNPTGLITFDVNTPTAVSSSSDTCSAASSLLFYNLHKTESCEVPYIIRPKQGSMTVGYDYTINTDTGSRSFSLVEGDCLK